MTFRTRFAPSPTGPLHLGHAYSACVAHDLAAASRGTFLLRIEDIDHTRARANWTQAIYDDLGWLGLTWDTPVLLQSSRLTVYRAALQSLWQGGLLYVCTCKRRDILEAISAPQEGVPMGPDGIIYPGTCRGQKYGTQFDVVPDSVLRLDMRAAFAKTQAKLGFTETGAGPAGETGPILCTAQDAIEGVGDIILARRDMGTSYHLSVVIDDAFQQVTDVVRGHDLFEATQIHVLLQTLLNLPTPRYHHHALIRDEAGKRLAKRDDARALSTYRAQGATPADIRAMVGL